MPFLHVLPFSTTASKLVAADVAIEIFGPRGGDRGARVAGGAGLINGNVFVTPRRVRDRATGCPRPRELNRGGTPWAAMLIVGAAATAIAITGTFEQLLGVAIALVLVTDSVAAVSLVLLRRREPASPFTVPAFPIVTFGFILVYAVLLALAVVNDPSLAISAGAVVGGAALLSIVQVRRRALSDA
jgi:hypothetical protein